MHLFANPKKLKCVTVNGTPFTGTHTADIICLQCSFSAISVFTVLSFLRIFIQRFNVAVHVPIRLHDTIIVEHMHTFPLKLMSENERALWCVWDVVQNFIVNFFAIAGWCCGSDALTILVAHTKTYARHAIEVSGVCACVPMHSDRDQCQLNWYIFLAKRTGFLCALIFPPRETVLHGTNVAGNVTQQLVPGEYFLPHLTYSRTPWGERKKYAKNYYLAQA